jgi:hypothetical protein
MNTYEDTRRRLQSLFDLRLKYQPMCKDQFNPSRIRGILHECGEYLIKYDHQRENTHHAIDEIAEELIHQERL